MHEPWLFWGSLAVLPVAGVCFMLAIRATSEKRELILEIATQVIAGVPLSLMGYESAFRTATKSIHEMQINTAAGLLFLTFGILLLSTAVAKAFGK